MEAGGSVRPIIQDKAWPSKYEVRKYLKQLMESCWNANITERPKTMAEVIAVLNTIDPQRGG